MIQQVRLPYLCGKLFWGTKKIAMIKESPPDLTRKSKKDEKFNYY